MRYETCFLHTAYSKLIVQPGYDWRILNEEEEVDIMGKSATALGKPYYMTGRQFNFLLYQQGFLEGNPGAWVLTPKGEQYAEVRDYHRGTGGYDHYNRYWSETVWKDEIVEHLNLSVKALQRAIDAEEAYRKKG